MQSFTWGSDEGMQDLISKHNDKFQGSVIEDLRWSLTPNPSDFKTLVDSLLFSYKYAVKENNPDLSDAASDLLSSIAESLGIEFI